MRLCRCKIVSGAGDATVHVGIVREGKVDLLSPAAGTLAAFLAAPDVELAIKDCGVVATLAIDEVRLLAPIDQQEVWAAGVTYQRSQKARMEESEQAASFYDRVYTAPRPELFFKATPHRVSGPDEPVRIRSDTRWSVPEPELTLVLSPDLRLVGFTIGNDMSARDIEGENPLYLPQAKIYRQSAALGPVVTLTSAMPPLDQTEITLAIQRGEKMAFRGQTRASSLKRTFPELIAWLGRDNQFPSGVFLMTGTGIVPPDDFSLEAGDQIAISITGIGTLRNPVDRENVS